MNNYVQRGDTITATAPYALTSGQGCKSGNRFGVSVNNQNSGDSSELVVVGVFDLAKDSSTFNSGDKVYWNDVAKQCTSVQGSNMEIGVVTLEQPSGTNAPGGATGDATVRVRLNSVPVGGKLNVAHATYNFAVDGGASCTPSISDTIPANALVFGGVVNSPTAVTAAGSATVSVGTTAGSGAASILAATAKASLSLDAVLPATAAATPFKMSAAGQISIAVATGPLTAGVLEIDVYYVVPSEA